MDNSKRELAFKDQSAAKKEKVTTLEVKFKSVIKIVLEK